MDRETIEKILIDEGASVMKLTGLLNKLKQSKDEKNGELRLLDEKIKKLVKVIKAKGGQASIN